MKLIPFMYLGCVQKFFLTFRTIFVHKIFSPCSAKRRASDKDLPVTKSMKKFIEQNMVENATYETLLHTYLSKRWVLRQLFSQITSFLLTQSLCWQKRKQNGLSKYLPIFVGHAVTNRQCKCLISMKLHLPIIIAKTGWEALYFCKKKPTDKIFSWN